MTCFGHPHTGDKQQGGNYWPWPTLPSGEVQSPPPTGNTISAARQRGEQPSPVAAAQPASTQTMYRQEDLLAALTEIR